MNQMWIRYEPENGRIHSVGPLKDDSLPGTHSPIDYFTALEFIKEEKNINEWIAVPDPLNPDLAKLINTVEEQMDYDISKSIYQIKKTFDDNDANFTIEQHSDKWLLRMKKNLVTVLKDNDFYKEKVYNFYITNEDDPNILLDSFAVKMEDVFKGDVTVDNSNKDVLQKSNVSIYAYKLFDSYQHLVKI